WRGKYNEQLSKKISELNLEKDVKVINGIVNMPEMYANVHVTVIPFLNLWRSPEIPLSAVESLVCGRPVITTDVVEIAEIVKRHKCGCVARPVKDDFSMALKECKRNYKVYQGNYRGVADALFSFDGDRWRWLVK
ncbi:MAG: glycosyltransferase family 4 protein, partial [Candidatus Odinarchaeota archaeon]|nr:glycosyltransferase family 4 protein [Candidatus Odinarchaeota archaeon]